jgi:hypothetical protein
MKEGRIPDRNRQLLSNWKLNMAHSFLMTRHSKWCKIFHLISCVGSLVGFCGWWLGALQIGQHTKAQTGVETLKTIQS